MDSVAHVNVPLRGGKKMKKRKELDALVAHTINKRSTDVKRSGSAGGVSSHDQLLSDSTDDQDYWTSSAGGKSLRCHRRRYLVRRRTCSTFLRACSAILIFTCVVATTTVMWLFIDVREQVTNLRTELNQVVAGSQGVPDALQKCHSLSRDLKKNQTVLMDRLSSFAMQLSNFSLEMSEVKTGLHTVQDKLNSSPDLINIPKRVEDLSASVASLGSKIKDLDSTVTTLKDQNSKLNSDLDALLVNLTDTKTKLTELSSSTTEKSPDKDLVAWKEGIVKNISQVSENLSSVNDTLSNKLQWTVSDRAGDHKLLESLQEMNQNVTARLKTLEVLCAKDAEAKQSKLNPTPPPPPQIPSSQGIPTTSQYSTNNEEGIKKSENQP